MLDRPKTRAYDILPVRQTGGEYAMTKKDVPGEGVSPESPSMTEAAFVAELDALIKRGEDAGLSPLTIIVRVCFRRGVGILDGFLANVETNIGSGKKGG